MDHRDAHAQRGEMNRDDVNMNEAGEWDDIIGIEPARMGVRRGRRIYEYDAERCKAESKKDDMTTDR